MDPVWSREPPTVGVRRGPYIPLEESGNLPQSPDRPQSRGLALSERCSLTPPFPSTPDPRRPTRSGVRDTHAGEKGGWSAPHPDHLRSRNKDNDEELEHE